MRKLTLARRLSLIVMGVLVVMSAVIMAVVFSITRRTMVAETESRYEGIVMLTNEKIRGVIFFLKRQGKFKKCCNFADVYAVKSFVFGLIYYYDEKKCCLFVYVFPDGKSIFFGSGQSAHHEAGV